MKEQPSLRKECREGVTTLQDMPLEILDMILMKTVLSSISRLKKSQPCPAVDMIQEVVEMLMTVWSEWCRRLNTRWFRIKFCRLIRKSNSFLWKIISINQPEHIIVGFTKLQNRMYVLCSEPSTIYVHEDHGDFRLFNTISLSETIPIVCGIHSSPRADCIYVLEAADQHDHFSKAVWKMDAQGKNVTKWLEDSENEILFSITEDNIITIIKQPVYSRRSDIFPCTLAVRVEIYQSDSRLMTSFKLPDHVFETYVHRRRRSAHKMIANGIHMQDGNLIISYQYVKLAHCVSKIYATAVIHVDKNGKVMSAVSNAHFRTDYVDDPMPTEELTNYFLHYPSFVTLDGKGKRLFATNYKQNILFVFDYESLNWIDTIRLHENPSEEITLDYRGRDAYQMYYVSEKRRAFPIYFDCEKRELLVRNYKSNQVEVYKVL